MKRKKNMTRLFMRVAALVCAFVCFGNVAWGQQDITFSIGDNERAKNQLQVTVAHANATIRYTKDGTTPNASSLIPISTSSSGTNTVAYIDVWDLPTQTNDKIKVYASWDGGASSATSEKTIYRCSDVTMEVLDDFNYRFTSENGEWVYYRKDIQRDGWVWYSMGTKIASGTTVTISQAYTLTYFSWDTQADHYHSRGCYAFVEVPLDANTNPIVPTTTGTLYSYQIQNRNNNLYYLASHPYNSQDCVQALTEPDNQDEDFWTFENPEFCFFDTPYSFVGTNGGAPVHWNMVGYRQFNVRNVGKNKYMWYDNTLGTNSGCIKFNDKATGGDDCLFAILRRDSGNGTYFTLVPIRYIQVGMIQNGTCCISNANSTLPVSLTDVWTWNGNWCFTNPKAITGDPTVEFTPNYTDQTLSITANPSGTNIRYTYGAAPGTEPQASSALYASPFQINKNDYAAGTVFRARAEVDGTVYAEADPFTITYASDPVASFNGSTITLTSTGNRIFYTFDDINNNPTWTEGSSISSFSPGVTYHAYAMDNAKFKSDVVTFVTPATFTPNYGELTMGFNAATANTVYYTSSTSGNPPTGWSQYSGTPVAVNATNFPNNVVRAAVNINGEWSPVNSFSISYAAQPTATYNGSTATLTSGGNSAGYTFYYTYDDPNSTPNPSWTAAPNGIINNLQLCTTFYAYAYSTDNALFRSPIATLTAPCKVALYPTYNALPSNNLLQMTYGAAGTYTICYSVNGGTAVQCPSSGLVISDLTFDDGDVIVAFAKDSGDVQVSGSDSDPFTVHIAAQPTYTYDGYTITFSSTGNTVNFSTDNANWQTGTNFTIAPGEQFYAYASNAAKFSSDMLVSNAPYTIPITVTPNYEHLYTANTITITSSTNATIYYTDNGGDPKNEPHYTYSGPINANQHANKTIRAIAVVEGTHYSSEITPFTVSHVAEPTGSYSAELNSYTFSGPLDAETTIYWSTSSTTPSLNDPTNWHTTTAGNSIQVLPSQKLCAFAINTGKFTSTMLEFDAPQATELYYVVDWLNRTLQWVPQDPTNEVRYSYGSNPVIGDANTQTYTGILNITPDIYEEGCKIIAVEIVDGSPSVPVTFTVHYSDNPAITNATFAWPTGENCIIDVTYTLTSEGSNIYYTLDGSDPLNSETYIASEGTITITHDNSAARIKAYAKKENAFYSEVIDFMPVPQNTVEGSTDVKSYRIRWMGSTTHNPNLTYYLGPYEYSDYAISDYAGFIDISLPTNEHAIEYYWILEDAGDGKHYIRQRSSGKYIIFANYNNKNTLKLVDQSDAIDQNDAKFTLEQMGGLYNLWNGHNNNSPNPWGNNDSQPMLLSACTSSTPPLWIFTDEQTTLPDAVFEPTYQHLYAENQLAINSYWPGAEVRYTTNGDTPTTSSTLYNGQPLAVNNLPTTNGTATVKAITVKDGYTSAVNTFTVRFADLPTAGFCDGTHLELLSSDGATIYYTTNLNASPSLDWAHVNSGDRININSATRFKAFAVHDNMFSSNWTIIEVPNVLYFNPHYGLTYSNNSLEMSYSGTGNIYYQIGNSGTWTLYEGPVNVNGIANETIVTAIVKDENEQEIEGSRKTFLVQFADSPAYATYNTQTNRLSVTATLGSTIYYNTSNVDPSLGWQHVTADEGILVTQGATLYVFATHPDKFSTDKVQIEWPSQNIIPISDLSGIDDETGHYQLTADIVLSGNTTIANFKGVLDGNHHTITGLTQPLFGELYGATIKNLYLDKINVTADLDTLGAFANIACGATRIYNCGILSTAGLCSEEESFSKVAAGVNTKVVGGIVGSLRGSSRVINCFSYANVEIAGADHIAGGIVGYNHTASTVNNLKTMVMNTMMYGKILVSNSATGYYTFGGQPITNKANGSTSGINLYNYYRYTKGETMEDREVNGTQACYEPYISRFQLFMGTLNSNRRLCAFYITGDANDIYEVDKWHHNDTTLTTALKNTPYPILGRWGFYSSAINKECKTASAKPYNGKQLGTLQVTVKRGFYGSGNDLTITLPITDMDTLRNDYNYYKVQLPYYNQYFGGNYEPYSGENRVVTGWKVTSITGGTAGELVTEPIDDPNLYNYADRNCTQKDLYSTSGRVLAQGGYFYVPEGVTAITIEAYWGKAIFLSDPTLDITYKRMDLLGQTNSGDNEGVNFTNAGDNPSTYMGASVYHSLSDALDQLQNEATVFDQALVLVGNLHHFNNFQTSDGQYFWVKRLQNNYPFSFMSVDADNDCEPDYCYYYACAERQVINPVRFDQLWFVPLGMATKTVGEIITPCNSIFRPKGWFEITETVPCHFTEFEYDFWTNGITKGTPVILNNGVIDQMVAQNGVHNADQVSYIRMGGHVWVKEFYPGAHISSGYTSERIPIVVTGGEYTKLSLTGMKPSTGTNNTTPGRIYTNGGRFDEFWASYMERLNGDVYGRWSHSIIGDFSGGSFEATYNVKGNIYHSFDHCLVKDVFTGGPKFGNVESGKTITIEANNTIFCKDVFGAGYGGFSTQAVPIIDHTSSLTSAAGSDYQYKTDYLEYYKTGASPDNGYIPGYYYDKAKKVEPNGDVDVKAVLTGYKWEYFPWPSGLKFVQRWYNLYSKLSFTTTHDVNVTMTDCELKANYYGGGNIGKVAGNITTALHNCTVAKNVYGAGFSAAIPTIDVMPPTNSADPDEQPIVMQYLPELGLFSQSKIPAGKTYTAHAFDGTVSQFTDKANAVNPFEQLIYTDQSLVGLGQVTGDVSLTIDGNSTVGGAVYGGGAQSDIAGNITVTVGGQSKVTENVFGGGEQGNVLQIGSTTDASVEATVKDQAKVGPFAGGGHIHGGGKLGDVFGHTLAQLQNEAECYGLYGGGRGNKPDSDGGNREEGDVVHEPGEVTGYTCANMTGGVVHGNLVGAGEYGWMNEARQPHDNSHQHTSTATISGGLVEGNVYGAGEMGKTFGHSIANVNGGSVKGDVYAGAMGSQNAVYMGGLKTCNVTGGTVYGNVYGGSQNADDGNYFYDGIGEDHTTPPTHSQHVEDFTSFVNVIGGTMKKNVYGGGYFGKTYGSIAIFCGANTLDHQPYAGGFNPNRPSSSAKSYLNIAESIYAGSNWGVISEGQDFGENDVWGYSHIVVDGVGYNTGFPGENSNPEMRIGNSLYGCGTSTDAGMLGRNIYINHYGYSTQSGGVISDPTRSLYTIQRCDSIAICNSHINLIGKGDQTSAVTTEKYAIINVEESVALIDGSTVTLSAPVKGITMLSSLKKNPDKYLLLTNPNTDFYEVSYGPLGGSTHLGNCDNKFRFNMGYDIKVDYPLIWGEFWSFANDGTKLSAYTKTGTIPIKVQNDANFTYSSTGTEPEVSESNNAEGEVTEDDKELKMPAGSTFTVNNIPTENKTFLLLIYYTSSTDGTNDPIEITSITDATSNSPIEYCIIEKYNDVFAYNIFSSAEIDKINITFTNNKSGDAYLDDIYLTSQRGLERNSYGAIHGFFHVSGIQGTVSFAYARPKVTGDEQHNPSIYSGWHEMNKDDGGFVSYSATQNTFDINGDPVASDGVQIAYTNHMPKNESTYYRVWVFKDDETGFNNIDGVLIARTQGSDENLMLTTSCTIQMPPTSIDPVYDDAEYYFVIEPNNPPEVNFSPGNDLRLVNGGIRGYEGNDPIWMDYHYDPDLVDWVYEDYYTPFAGENNPYIENIQASPNNTFGLAMIPGSGTDGISDGSEAILFARNANGWEDQKIMLPSDPTELPELTFLLTYSNGINMNATLDPITLTVKQYMKLPDGEPVLKTQTLITLPVTTVTNIEQNVTINDFAKMMNTGTTHDVFAGKVTLPAFSISDQTRFSKFKVTDIEVIQGEVGEGLTDLVDTLYFDDHVGNAIQYGLTFASAKTYANMDGWEPTPEYQQLHNTYEIISGHSSPYHLDEPILLGETDGRKEFSIDFFLHFNGAQLASNAQIDKVRFTVQFDNFGQNSGDWHTIYIDVNIHRRGSAVGFYLDGINGSNANSGIYPDDAKRTLKGIFDNYDPANPSNVYAPGDLIFVVNDANIVTPDHEWNGKPYEEVVLYRYPGDHEQKFATPRVPANEGPLVTVNNGANLIAENIVLDGLSWKSGSENTPTKFIRYSDNPNPVSLTYSITDENIRPIDAGTGLQATEGPGIRESILTFTSAYDDIKLRCHNPSDPFQITRSCIPVTTNTTPPLSYYKYRFNIICTGATVPGTISLDIYKDVEVLTVEANNITTSSATVMGNVVSEGNSNVTERGICWGTTVNPTISGNHSAQGSGVGVYNVEITGLTTNTNYYARAYATNSESTYYGDNIIFTTVGLPVVSTGDVTDITNTSATCGGNITSEGASNITERGICYSLTANPTTADNKVAHSEATTGSYTCNISGLTTNKTYYVRAYATNSQGTAYGEEISFTTTGLPTVTTSAVTNVTSTTATSGGTAAGASAVTACGVCWATTKNPVVDGNHTDDFANMDGSGNFTSSITGLTDGRTYYVRAYATNGQGTAYGEEICFIATSTLPTVSTANVSNITQTTATCGGTVTSSAAVTARGVCWSTNKYPKVNGSKTEDGTGAGNFESSITNLKPGTTYYVRAYATTSDGTNYGEQMSFTTEAGLPSVRSYKVNNVNETSAQFTGVVTDEGGTNVIERGVCYGTSNDPTTADSHLAKGSGLGSYIIQLTGLTTGNTYYARAYATNTAGTSYGQSIQFKTAVEIDSLNYYEDEKYNPNSNYIRPLDGLMRVVDGATAEFTESQFINNNNYLPREGEEAPSGPTIHKTAGIDINSGGKVTLVDSKVGNNYLETSNNTEDQVIGAGVYLGGDLTVVDVSDEERYTTKIDDNHIWYMTQTSTPRDSIVKTSNVFIPDYENRIMIGIVDGFEEYQLRPAASIGVTKTNFTKVTLDDMAYTPVASACDENLYRFAEDAFTNLNFFDDKGKYPLFYSDIPPYEDFTDYFHKTWVTEVTSQPTGFALNNIDSKEDLAWLISYVNGFNGSSAHPGAEATLTADVNMKEYVFVPIGHTSANAFTGTFNGQYHAIDGINAYYPGYDAIGVFGHVKENAVIKNTFVRSGTAYTSEENSAVGGIVGVLEGNALMLNCESADSLRAYNQSVVIGGLVGRTMGTSRVHSSYSAAKLYGYDMGGLVGELAEGTYLENSFALTGFNVRDENLTNCKIGGLVGINKGKTQNCYVRLRDDDMIYGNNFGLFAGENFDAEGSDIKYCYAPGFGIGDIPYVGSGKLPSIYAHYTEAVTPYYYKHADNTLTYWQGSDPGSINVEAWPAMLNTLNAWVNSTDEGIHNQSVNYTPWMRTTADIINNDYPIHKNPDFKAVFVANDGETLLDSKLLRYTDHFNGTVARYINDQTAIDLYKSIDSVHVYNDGSLAKLYINEDVTICTDYSSPDDSRSLNAYAGITFKNENRSAHAWDGSPLNRDWHLFGSPFNDAALGVDYNGNSNQYNYWTGNDVPEFNFLVESSGDGFFPSCDFNTRGSYYSDWDYYCFYEPQYHWINFKRNTPSHWHEDGLHEHIEYTNENHMRRGKGYMMAIQEETFMQSYGKLNDGTIASEERVSNEGTHLTGYNLLGNPFLSYLDFDEFAVANSVLWKDAQEGDPSHKKGYLVYDANADGFIGYKEGTTGTGWTASRYLHPMQGFFIFVDNAATEAPYTYAKFNNDMRSLQQADSPFRDEIEEKYPVINLWMNNGHSGNDILVIELQHPEVDGFEKMKNIKMGNAILYAHHEDTDFSIFFAEKDADQVPVWFSSSVDDVYTIYWETENADFAYLHLIDNITGMDVDCLENDHYIFTASQEDYESRFKLVFKLDDDPEEPDEPDAPFAFFYEGNLIVNGTGTFQFFDINGRLLLQTDLYNQQNTVSLPKVSCGVYLGRLIEGKNAKVQKLIVNQ